MGGWVEEKNGGGDTATHTDVAARYTLSLSTYEDGRRSNGGTTVEARPSGGQSGRRQIDDIERASSAQGGESDASRAHRDGREKRRRDGGGGGGDRAGAGRRRRGEEDRIGRILGTVDEMSVGKEERRTTIGRSVAVSRVGVERRVQIRGRVQVLSSVGVRGGRDATAEATKDATALLRLSRREMRTRRCVSLSPRGGRISSRVRRISGRTDSADGRLSGREAGGDYETATGGSPEGARDLLCEAADDLVSRRRSAEIVETRAGGSRGRGRERRGVMSRRVGGGEGFKKKSASYDRLSETHTPQPIYACSASHRRVFLVLWKTICRIGVRKRTGYRRVVLCPFSCSGNQRAVRRRLLRRPHVNVRGTFRCEILRRFEDLAIRKAFM